MQRQAGFALTPFKLLLVMDVQDAYLKVKRLLSSIALTGTGIMLVEVGWLKQDYGGQRGCYKKLGTGAALHSKVHRVTTSA